MLDILPHYRVLSLFLMSFNTLQYYKSSMAAIIFRQGILSGDRPPHKKTSRLKARSFWINLNQLPLGDAQGLAAVNQVQIIDAIGLPNGPGASAILLP